MKNKHRSWERRNLNIEKKILEENEDKFDLYSEVDTYCDKYADFVKKYLDPHKSFNYEELSFNLC